MFIYSISDVEPRADIVNNPDGFLFPKVGPYLCEVCSSLIVTNRAFVNHIDKNHNSIIDPQVLEVMKQRIAKKRPSNVATLKGPDAKVTKSSESGEWLLCVNNKILHY